MQQFYVYCNAFKFLGNIMYSVTILWRPDLQWYYINAIVLWNFLDLKLTKKKNTMYKPSHQVERYMETGLMYQFINHPYKSQSKSKNRWRSKNKKWLKIFIHHYVEQLHSHPPRSKVTKSCILYFHLHKCSLIDCKAITGSKFKFYKYKYYICLSTI